MTAAGGPTNALATPLNSTCPWENQASNRKLEVAIFCTSLPLQESTTQPDFQSYGLSILNVIHSLR